MNRVLYILIAASLMTAGYFLYVKQSRKTLRMAITEEEEQAFFDYKQLFNKNYENMNEHNYRLSVFVKNVHEFQQHNAGVHTYTKGINQFTDMTRDEFRSKVLMTIDEMPQPTGETFVPRSASVPDSVDWRQKSGVVTPVKDQGQCGSCWSFSTTGVLEGTFGLDDTNSMLSFAEQQLVDCSTSYGNQGCNGGWPYQAASYVEDHGIVTEDKYPYTARDGNCKMTSGDYKSTKHTMVQQGDVDGLAAAIAQQPTSVCVDASNWFSYSSGIFSDCASNIDHAVLAVGYNKDAWIVKNSWNTSWGENGYIRLARGNTCAIANVAMTTSKQ